MTDIHLVATLLMAGVIVFVQIVHYPLMSQVGVESFIEYERAHTARTAWVVVPLMTAELASAVWLALLPPAEELRMAAWTGVAVLGAIWVSTALLQGPSHGRLVHGFDRRVHRLLVRSNWIRTVGWISRVPLAMSLAA